MNTVDFLKNFVCLGFFVVRTKDVVASAKEMKNGGTGSSIQDLSIVDVSVGKVHVLALSNDNSFLAAVVAGDVHLFSVDSLLDKVVLLAEACPNFKAPFP